MSSKIKKLKDLERKLTVSVPVEDYEKKYSASFPRLNPQPSSMDLERAMCLMMFLNKDMEILSTMKF